MSVLQNYTIGDVVAENKDYRLRKCWETITGRELLLQIANDISKSAGLSRNAWILTKLANSAEEIDEKRNTESKKPLGFKYGFPELLDSAIVSIDSLITIRDDIVDWGDQRTRQVNVLGFRNVNSLVNIIPLVKLWKDSLRVDLRSSAWMLGKLLKLISFAHSNQFEIGDISGNNILIDPNNHYIIAFNWANAIIHEDGVPSSIVKQEIKKAASLIIKALGEDLSLTIVNDADNVYVDYIKHLATNGESDTFEAHKTFYEIVDSLCNNPDSVWKPGFYKFTTLKRGTHG